MIFNIIFVNIDNSLNNEQPKALALRKIIRTIIEVNGGDGKEVKKHIEVN